MKPVCIVLLFAFYINVNHAQPDKKSSQTYHLIFQTAVGDAVLQADSIYQNRFGEAFKVHSFKYYISHIQLLYKDGKVDSPRTAPHLINEADSNSKVLSFTAPAGIITGIRFLLGIDSTTNTAGVQTGDLDPAKGMFWIWNTGYIMAKLEGTSSYSKAPGKGFSYDIGGYKTGENVTRQIALSLSNKDSYSLTAFIITADISKWFYGKNKIMISEQPMCHSPGALAMQVADNYAGMFSIRAQ